MKEGGEGMRGGQIFVSELGRKEGRITTASHMPLRSRESRGVQESGEANNGGTPRHNCMCPTAARNERGTEEETFFLKGIKCYINI